MKWPMPITMPIRARMSSDCDARATELQAELVVTTEKDACKLAALLQLTDSWWAVRLTTYVIAGKIGLSNSC